MTGPSQPSLWIANPGWWTQAGAHIPWLRPDSQHVHIVRSGLEQAVRAPLESVRYEVVTLADDISDRESLMEATKGALRLWDYCRPGWDSWRDCLCDLNDIWPQCDRLALLWPRSDLLLKSDLPTWLVAIDMLREASVFLQTKPELSQAQELAPDYVRHRLMVFETFCFVADLGAQGPST
ncbi:MAG: barstar family protein [Acidimicrobiia bacterium]